MEDPLVLLFTLGCLLQGVCGAGSDEVSEVSVKEGSSVSLDSGVKTNQQDKIRWYFNNIRIALITGDLTKICTDVQCNEGTERFRGRLKLDNQTGSLTITNIRTTDSGEYRAQISRANSSNSQKTYSVNVHSFFSVSTEGVSVFVMERDTVTFQTNVETNQQSTIKWYFYGIRIAQISGDLSKICTDVQCNKGSERFRDRLKLDQTGSLTITNTRTTDSGEYELIINSKNNGEKGTTFKFFIHDVSASCEQNNIKEMKGQNITLYTKVISQQDLLTWKFNNTLIAQITGDQSQICSDDQCKQRFRDRLKLDQTGSLTITNITTTDAGEYTLQINSSRFSISRSFSVTVTDGLSSVDRDPGPPSGGTHVAVVYGVVAAVVLLIAAVSVGIYCCCKQAKQKSITETDPEAQNNHNEEEVEMLHDYIEMNSGSNGMSTDQQNSLVVENGTQ